MDTKDIKQFYNSSLGNSENKYEFKRWFKNGQAKASYAATAYSAKKYALPRLSGHMSVFELGPGPGTWTKLMIEKAPNASYDLVDISEAMLGQAKDSLGEPENIKYVCSDILDFQSDKKYDFFFSSRMIEYVPDKKGVVSIIYDSLNSGSYGYIVTKTPQDKRFFKKHSYTNVHKGQIESGDLVSLFEAQGFEVVEKFHVTCVFPGLRSGFIDRITTFVCRLLPFSVANYVSESYAIVFKKK